MNMNYQMLKTLLESLLINFKCPNCQWQATDNNIEIVWAAWNSINLDIFCSVCQKHTFVKSEVSQINLWNIVDLKPENISEFKEKLTKKLSKINLWKNENTTKNIDSKINEKEIIELRKLFKNKHIKVEDLLN